MATYHIKGEDKLKLLLAGVFIPLNCYPLSTLRKNVLKGIKISKINRRCKEKRIIYIIFCGQITLEDFFTKKKFSFVQFTCED